jgi:hypothetical protein
LIIKSVWRATSDHDTYIITKIDKDNAYDSISDFLIAMGKTGSITRGQQVWNHYPKHRRGSKYYFAQLVNLSDKADWYEKEGFVCVSDSIVEKCRYGSTLQETWQTIAGRERQKQLKERKEEQTAQLSAWNEKRHHYIRDAISKNWREPKSHSFDEYYGYVKSVIDGELFDFFDERGLEVSSRKHGAIFKFNIRGDWCNIIGALPETPDLPEKNYEMRVSNDRFVSCMLGYGQIAFPDCEPFTGFWFEVGESRLSLWGCGETAALAEAQAEQSQGEE